MRLLTSASVRARGQTQKNKARVDPPQDQRLARQSSLSSFAGRIAPIDRRRYAALVSLRRLEKASSRDLEMAQPIYRQRPPFPKASET